MSDFVKIEFFTADVPTMLKGLEFTDDHSRAVAGDIAQAFLDSTNATEFVNRLWASFLEPRQKGETAAKYKERFSFFEYTVCGSYHNLATVENGAKMQDRFRSRLANACKLAGIDRLKVDGDQLVKSTTRTSSATTSNTYTKGMSTTAKNIGKKRNISTRVRLFANMMAEAGLGAGDIDALEAALNAIKNAAEAA